MDLLAIDRGREEVGTVEFPVPEDICGACEASAAPLSHWIAVLGILLGCGYVGGSAELEAAHIQWREDHWAILDSVGKVGTFAQYRFRIGARRPMTLV